MPQFNYVFQGVSGCIAPFWKFCIPILVPLFVFPHLPYSTSRFHFSFTFSQRSFPFLFLFFFLISNFSFSSHPLSFLSCLPPSFFCTLVFSFILPPLFTSALIHSSSASLFYMGRWQSSWPTMAMCQRQ